MPYQHASLPPTGVVTLPLASLTPQPVRWLWPGRVPLGKLTLLAGDPGLGKSFVTLDLAARLSAGRDLPDAKNPLGGPASALFLSAEDDPADTLLPRLVAMGADLTRIHVLDRLLWGADRRPGDFRLDRDIRSLREALRTLDRPRLIVIDPISAYMGKVDDHRNSEVRAVLRELSDFAAAQGVAVLAVTHLNKAKGERAVYRAMGSLAFTAAARVVHLVAKHPDDPDQRIVAPVKCNIGEERLGLAYRIETVRAPQGGEGPGWADAPSLVWTDTKVTLRADDLDSPESAEHADALEEACAFLEDALKAGPVEVTTVRAQAEEAGHSWITVKRAKRRLGLASTRPGGEGPWLWSHRAR